MYFRFKNYMRHYLNHKTPAYIFFLDANKTFYGINHLKLFKTLVWVECGIENMYITTINACVSDGLHHSTSIKHEIGQYGVKLKWSQQLRQSTTTIGDGTRLGLAVPGCDNPCNFNFDGGGGSRSQTQEAVSVIVCNWKGPNISLLSL